MKLRMVMFILFRENLNLKPIFHSKGSKFLTEGICKIMLKDIFFDGKN